MKRYIQGMKNLVKVATGQDRAPAHIVSHRRQICNYCMHRRGAFCGACGCVIAAKAKLLAERCPKGRW